MSAPSFVEQERELLRELAALFTLRSDRERAINSRLSEGTAAAEAGRLAAINDARRVFDGALSAAQKEHDERRARAESDFDARISTATAAMNSALGAFNERTQSIVNAIKERRQESEWFSEAMLESGQDRIRPAFEAARKSILQRTTELDAIEKSAQSALAHSRHAGLPGVPEPVPAPAVPLDGALAFAHAAAARLHSAIRPGIVSPAGVVAWLLVFGLLGLAIGGGRGWIQPADALPRALPGLGVGAVAGLLVALALRMLLRRRVPIAAANLAQVLAGARAAASASLRSAEAARDAKIASLASMATQEAAGSRASVHALRAELERRTSRLEPELRAHHESVISALRAERDGALAEIDRRFEERRAAIESIFTSASNAAEEAMAATRLVLEAADRAERATLESEWTDRIARASARADALAASAVSPAWNSPHWQDPSPPLSVPAAVPFGALRLDMAALPGGLSTDPRLAVPGSTVRELPLTVDLLGKGSVLLRATPDRRDAALAALNNIVLRLLTGLPPGKARFTLIDPVGLGQSFAGLMHISDYEEDIVGERIWTDPRHVDQRLADLAEHMETVIQKYLRNEYETIQAYNAEAGEVAEPYRFLVIADFPAAISDVAAKKLASIATSGARCGVFTLLMTTQPSGSRGSASSLPWAEIERNSTVLQLGPDGARWTDEPFSPWPITLESPPDEASLTRLLHQVGERVKDSTVVRVPFSLVEPPDGRAWTADASAEIRVPLGRAGAKKLQHLSLGRATAQHALIGGRTGSGKSTLLHVIITAAALWYRPDQLELYLVDFKKGVEFKTYASNALPHARVVAVESEREFGLSVLRKLDAELTRRGSLFRTAGVQDLPAYRRARAAHPDQPELPRVMLIVDEFQEFFVEDDKIAQDAALLLDRLVRQGRAFGIHVVLGSQTLGGAYSLARSTLGQMAVRIALQCSEADSYLIMSEDNPAPRLLSRPGEAIYNDASGLIEGNSPFQIVWLSDEVRDAHLRRIAAANPASAAPQIVFEGNVPADLSTNRTLADLLERRTPRPAVPTLWLGDPLSIKDATGITLRAQSAASTLVVGNQEETLAAMCEAAVLSFGAWLCAGSDAADAGTSFAPITILDATPPDLPHADLLKRTVEAMGSRARFAGPRQAGEVLTAAAAEIDRREASGQATHAPLLLVIHGLQRFRELRRADDFSFSPDAAALPPVLSKVLRSGPPVGLHVLAICDTATNVDRMLERSALREFNTRVLLQMSAGDSTQLIDGPQASALGQHRALLYSDDSGVVEKFRPYGPPAPEWIARTLAALARA